MKEADYVNSRENAGKKSNENMIIVVGLGYDEHHITAEAICELSTAEAVMGHESLISSFSQYLSEDVIVIHDEDIRKKTDDIELLKIYRTKEAIKYALEGKKVVYLCPGDPGIYSYAQPILELSAGIVKVKVIPGMTSALVAAAMLGAPLWDGFALIGLYLDFADYRLIEKRVKAAITCDQVIVFYLPKHEALVYPQFYPEEKYPHLYPREVKCVERLEKAFSTLLEVRSPETPLGIACLKEENEIISTILGDYKDVFEDIHPYSTVIVGNSMSKYAGEYFVTSLWKELPE
ncbi:MAG: hypothetical protein HXS44_04675 [Theionarchaea archaeon]|nr:hypothetical protein [Theionarchaea archaeon]